jgi:ribosomal-protein-alanine N-acetyltransferase
LIELLTNRLVINELTESDADFILRLVNSPTWIENIGDRGLRTIPDAIEFIKEGPMTSYKSLGVGLWRVALSENRMPIGICGLLKRESLPYMDIGMAFLPEYTRQGYATEAATTCVRYAFYEKDAHEILAVTSKENERAVALLKRLKFSYQREIPFTAEEKLQLYCLKEAI